MVKPFIKSLINRREFIGTTAAAGAGLLLTSCSNETTPAPAAKKSALNAINVGLIGYGAEGSVLSDSLMNIMNTGDIKVVALCDIWDYARKKGRNTYKANGFELNDCENYEDLLAKEKDLQAVIVATPD